MSRVARFMAVCTLSLGFFVSTMVGFAYADQRAGADCRTVHLSCPNEKDCKTGNCGGPDNSRDSGA